MEVTASAPAKAILFGEHAVVYGKPAVAVAVCRRAYVTVKNRENKEVHIKINDPNLSGVINPENGEVQLKNIDKKDDAERTFKRSILDYMMSAILKVQRDVCKEGMDIEVNLDVPIGAGLGSSAAITVATIAAVSKFNNIELTKKEIAEHSHNVEIEVQGAASPIDTTLSTYGGVIYLSKNAEALPLKIDRNIPLVIGCTKEKGNTGELVESVKTKKETYPEVINPILNAIEAVTDDAVNALMEKNEKRIGELMNINHGLLDALGVNTMELSRMIYTARKAGALGSKITGAGGGGSIIAYCPGKVDEVLSSLNGNKAFNADLSMDGVKVEVRK